jgi:paraquat-inducible protein A
VANAEPDHPGTASAGAVSAGPSWLIRALLLGSLTLLVTGAVAPLVTTEQFYFFSNTFTLISGLEQLAANDQFLIAALIALFSLCIPVLKAVVIWVAASGQASNRPLLLLADRLGKWSMLEVFIAALFIIALKLGPVVEAELHYGAWLLAGSVLLSGIASQLFVHEPHGGPIFSSQLTLTIGAIGGAAAATLLIGLLNPNLLRFEALLGTPAERCIERSFRLDRTFAETSASQTEYVNRLRDIDVQNCPAAFTAAFADYVDAWRRLDARDANPVAEPSLLDRGLALVGLAETREGTLDAIESAWAELAEAAGAHGIEAPAR